MISPTTDPLAGLILAGFTGLSAEDDEVQALVQLGVGGYILFGRNVESPEQVHGLLAGIRNSVGDRAVLYAVDQEGCLLYTSPSPRDQRGSRMPSSA